MPNNQRRQLGQNSLQPRLGKGLGVFPAVGKGGAWGSALCSGVPAGPLTRGSVTMSLGSATMTMGMITMTMGSATMTMGMITMTMGSAPMSMGMITMTLGSAPMSMGMITMTLGSATMTMGMITMTLGSATETLGMVTMPMGSATGTLGSRPWAVSGPPASGAVTMHRKGSTSRTRGRAARRIAIHKPCFENMGPKRGAWRTRKNDSLPPKKAWSRGVRLERPAWQEGRVVAGRSALLAECAHRGPVPRNK